MQRQREGDREGEGLRKSRIGLCSMRCIAGPDVKELGTLEGLSNDGWRAWSETWMRLGHSRGRGVRGGRNGSKGISVRMGEA
jgi:hypothetical protein